MNRRRDDREDDDLRDPEKGWLARFRQWRWNREHERYKQATGTYRAHLQVCPRGCMHKAARRDVLTKTGISGRAKVHVEYSFETTHCSECGSQFLDECSRCGNKFMAPLVDRCEGCGLPQPWATARRTSTGRHRRRQWHPESDARLAALKVFEAGRRSLFLIEGDVTEFDVDAVVSNDDVDGRMWTAVASSIRQALGDEVELESVNGGPYPLGQAWMTEHVGDIKAVIHVAAMDSRGKHGRWPTISDCVRSALELAREKEIESIALATIGTGVQAVPLEEWLDRVVSVIVASLLAMDAAVQLEVLVVLYETGDIGPAFQQAQHAVKRARLEFDDSRPGGADEVGAWAD